MIHGKPKCILGLAKIFIFFFFSPPARWRGRGTSGMTSLPLCSRRATTPLRPLSPQWSDRTSPVSFTWEISGGQAVDRGQSVMQRSKMSALIIMSFRFSAHVLFPFTWTPDIFALVRYNSQNDSYRWVPQCTLNVYSSLYIVAKLYRNY